MGVGVGVLLLLLLLMLLMLLLGLQLQPLLLLLGRDVKTCGYLGLRLGVCICLVGLLVSCLLMTLMATQTK